MFFIILHISPYTENNSISWKGCSAWLNDAGVVGYIKNILSQTVERQCKPYRVSTILTILSSCNFSGWVISYAFLNFKGFGIELEKN